MVGVAVGLLVVAGYAVQRLWEPLGPTAELWTDNLLQLGAAVWASVACGLAARRGDAPHRRSLRLLALACGCWAVGQLAWSVQQLVLGVELPFPSIADVGYLLALPPLVLAVACYPTSRLDTAGRVRALLDGLTVAVSLLSISWVVRLGPVVGSMDTGLLDGLVALTYPLADVVVATLAVVVVCRAAAGDRLRLLFITGGVVALAVADSGFAVTVAGQSPYDILTGLHWVVGFLAFAAAASVRARATPLAEVGPRAPALLDLLPYATFVGGGAVLIAVVASGQRIDRFLLICAGVMVLLGLAKQVLALGHNATLHRRLADAVAALQAREAELEQRATHDELTGLANRAMLNERLGDAVARRGPGQDVGLLYCDLDGFKLINDVLGHTVGDLVLVEVASRISASVRPGDTVARLGGDEFGVVLAGVSGVDDATQVGRRIVAAFQEPMEIAGHQLTVRVSIGAAVAEPHVPDGHALVRAADAAMYEAKRNTRGGVASYRPAIGSALDERLELASGLQRALHDGELTLHYQPIVAMGTAAAVGVEALVRWQQADGAMVSPRSFISVAEDTGVIVPIGAWVLEEACRRLHELHLAGFPQLVVAVNVSGTQLRSAGAAAELGGIIRASGVDPHCVRLEITESVLMDDDGDCAAALRELKTLGLTIAIDDFGTGYSSLRYLQRFPVDALKVDRSFVEGLGHQAEATAITTALVHLARALDLAVVAEGVETVAQRDLLLGLGVQHAQGFLWSPPMSGERLLTWLRRAPERELQALQEQERAVAEALQGR